MTDRGSAGGWTHSRLLASVLLVAAAAFCVGRSWGRDWAVPVLVTLELALPLVLAGVIMLRTNMERVTRSLRDGLLATVILIPPFLFAMLLMGNLDLRGFLERPLHRDIPFHIFAVAIPEEFFFRGFLQRTLERGTGKLRILRAECGAGLLLAAAAFALVHLVRYLQPWALLVFFPGLVFGWLYARRGSIAGAALFHAACNLSLLLCDKDLFS